MAYIRVSSRERERDPETPKKTASASHKIQFSPFRQRVPIFDSLPIPTEEANTMLKNPSPSQAPEEPIPHANDTVEESPWEKKMRRRRRRRGRMAAGAAVGFVASVVLTVGLPIILLCSAGGAVAARCVSKEGERRKDARVAREDARVARASMTAAIVE